MADCIFCKIIDGSIPSKTFYKDKNTIGFLDINPATPGHSLVVPKKHFTHIYDADSKTIGEMFDGVKKVAELVKTRLNADGLNIFINQGREAGQVIDHFHVHILPRYKGDRIKLIPPELKLSDDEMDAIFKKLTS